MHRELDDLLTRSIRFAKRVLSETGEPVPFAAILDVYGKPQFLNVETHPEYSGRPTTVAGWSEFLRYAIRVTKTTGALLCTPVRAEAVDGTWHDALEFHFDHHDDECAYRLLGYEITDGEARLHRSPVIKTDDRLIPLEGSSSRGLKNRGTGSRLGRVALRLPEPMLARAGAIPSGNRWLMS